MFILQIEAPGWTCHVPGWEGPPCTPRHVNCWQKRGTPKPSPTWRNPTTASGRGWGRERLGKYTGSVLQAGFDISATLQSSCPLLFCCACPTEPHLSLFWLYTQSHPFCVAVGEMGRDGGAVMWAFVCGVMVLLVWAHRNTQPRVRINTLIVCVADCTKTHK